MRPSAREENQIDPQRQSHFSAWAWAFVVALAAVLGSGFFAWQSLRNLAEASERIQHTQRVLRHTSDVYSYLAEARIAERTVLASGEKGALEQARELSVMVQRELDALEALTKDTPAQRARVQRLRTLAVDLLSVFNEAESLSGPGGQHVPAGQSNAPDRGTWPRLREVIRELRGAEESLLTQRAGSAEAAKEAATQFIGLTLLMALALVLAAVVVAGQFGRRNAELQQEVEERQAAEGERRSSDERLKLALQVAPVTLSTADREGRYTWVENVHPVFAGVPLLGKCDAELAEDGTLAALSRLKERVITSGKPERETIVLRHARGEHTFDVRVEPECAPDGSVTGVVIAAFDLTAVLSAQQELQEQERFTSSILDSSGDCIEVLNSDGRVVLVNNPGLCLLELRSRGELEGRPWLERWGKNQDKPAAALEEARAGRSARFQERAQAASGQVKWWDVMLTPSLRKQNAQREIVVISRDISEQRRLEEERARVVSELAASEAKLRAIANTMPQMVWSTRPDGYHDYFNERWYEYTGMPRPNEQGGEYDSTGSGQGWNWKDYLHPEDFSRTEQVWGRSLATGEPYYVEYRLRRSDGAYRWFIARAVALRDDSGAITRWFGTCTDIEEQKQIMRDRESLLAAERAARSAAERTVRMKDEFVATLSHELRTPLNAMLGWAQILRRHVSGEGAKALEVIERNARIQAKMVEDLLDTSRILSGKLRLEPERIELSPVIDAALASVQAAAAAKDISIQNVHGSDGVVYGDPNRLQQVLWNLLSNAIKFTPKGGRVQIVSRRVKSSLEVAVVDNGQGIAPSFLPHVFERFRQEDGSVSRRHGGLGLGLTIVKQIVETHGGTVEAFSEGEGQGATFFVRLPLAPVQTCDSGRDVNEPVLSERVLHGVAVVVVDDEADGRELVQRVLEEAGATVHCAASAREALEVLQTRGLPLVLVSDIGMPEEDGYTLIQRVRSLESAAASVPAVALTALARTEDRKRAILAGYQTHLAKPVDAGELITVVASLAGRLGAPAQLVKPLRENA